VLSIAGARLPSTYRRQLRRFTRAPAAFKVDYALSGPVPWTNPELSQAGTLHLGSSESIMAAQSDIWRKRRPQRPFIIIAQQSLFDPTRAPGGRHTLWAYAHVPAGTQDDYSETIESEIEFLAPGFRERILDRCVAGPADLVDYNPNIINGDITGGAYSARQILFRPVLARNPYAIPARGLYICSSSTPPGAGVHGMCGYWAARTALNRELK
jgi:phytoene dehydrogenase-like protein